MPSGIEQKGISMTEPLQVKNETEARRPAIESDFDGGLGQQLDKEADDPVVKI